MRVAVLVWRLGPYHHARLNAVGEPLFVIEACASDSTYAWEKVEGSAHFTRITLQDRDPVGRGEMRAFRDQVFRALDKINPEVVAIPGWSFVDALSALAWCISRRKPVIIMSDSTSGDAPRVSWKEAIKRHVVKLCSAAFAAGVPHKEYLEILGMPTERIFLGYDVVENDYFSTQALRVKSDAAALRAKHKLPAHYFLASARFVAKKNLPRLIEAFARYRNLAEGGEEGPWELVLIGDGPLREELVMAGDSFQVSQWIHKTGFKQYADLPVYYGLADAFIHPSTTEQWGLVVNEAMASGLPVLVSNRCGCAPDLVQEGVNGFTFDPFDVEQITQRMLQLTRMPKPLLEEMGQASSRIIFHWGPERFAAGLNEAAACALAVGAQPSSWWDRLLLRALLIR